MPRVTIAIHLTGGATNVPVSVAVNNFAAAGVSVSASPVDGLPGIVYQVQATVPTPPSFHLPSTNPVQVTMGTVESQTGITLYVK